MRTPLQWISTVFAVIAAGHAVAAESAPGWFAMLEENRPFAAVQALRRMPEQPQALAQASVFIGDEAPACEQFGRVAFPEDVQYRDAIDALPALVADRRVVMLNESHFRGAHRAFLLRLIELLHAQGFDVLAAETFSSAAPERLRRGVVDTEAGFYTADPLLAAAIRKAQASGWAFVDYEAMEGEGKEARETGQARKLAAWLDAHPERKLLVYAGGSHISKVPEDGWMAAHFVAMTGIDPLTIRQGATACPDNADAWPMDAAHAVVPFRDGAPLAGRDADIVVMHPPSAVAAAREVLGPPVAVCLQAIPQDTLLRAFGERDDGAAIAHDQRVVAAGETRGGLNLWPGRYRLEREEDGARQPLGVVEVTARHGGDCLRPQVE